MDEAGNGCKTHREGQEVQGGLEVPRRPNKDLVTFLCGVFTEFFVVVALLLFIVYQWLTNWAAKFYKLLNLLVIQSVA